MAIAVEVKFQRLSSRDTAIFRHWRMLQLSDTKHIEETVCVNELDRNNAFCASPCCTNRPSAKTGRGYNFVNSREVLKREIPIIWIIVVVS